MCCGSVQLIVAVELVLLKLEELVGDMYEDFEALNSVGNTSYELGSELW